MLVGNFPVNFSSEEKWFDSLGQDDKNIILAIETKDGKYLGNVGLHRIDWINRHAEGGVFIRKDEWGKGYATEAEYMMGKHGFEMGLKKIYARIFKDNPASLRAAEKNGCQVEGELKNHIFKNGKWHDIMLVAVFNDNMDQ
jgi:RimJ/RimL family protein N-acetyltransferase